MVKALILFSNGLDSRLVSMIMKNQLKSKNVYAVFFSLPFHQNSEKPIEQARRFCKKQKIKLKIVDCKKGKLLREYIKIIKKPKFKRGKQLNPCIDCHLFILKQIKKFIKQKNKYIIATGDVLNERPLSQNKKTLLLIDKKAGLKNRVLRPLSAKLLPKTIYEKNNIINRDELYGMDGKQRKQQIKLAKKFKISYPSPAGGCLLCEEKFCERLKSLLNKNISSFDIDILKLGRHFENNNIVLGRNEKENEEIEKLAKKHKKTTIIPEKPGPTAILKNKEYLEESKKLIQQYSKYKIENFKIKK